MPKRTSPADRRDVPVRLVIVTLDSHLSSAAARAARSLRRQWPGFELSVHAAADFGRDQAALERCLADIAAADLIVVSMLFMDEHIDAVHAALLARRDACDAIIGMLSGERVSRLTRLGSLKLDGFRGSLFGLLKRLRPRRAGNRRGQGQLSALARIPRLLKSIPGPARDLRHYFLLLQYWLSGSEQNLASLCRLLVTRYAAGPRAHLRKAAEPAAPIEYPETGLYHPRLPGRIGTAAAELPKLANPRGRIGILVMRSYVLAGNTAHYDGVIEALEAEGLEVIPAFASGLDATPAIDRFFRPDDVCTIDALLSLTGFSLVGGPAYNDADAAARLLGALDVPFVAAHAVEFQSLADWRQSELGLLPIETTLMQAIPELDGATGPIVFGGRATDASGAGRDMQADAERTGMLASRLSRLVALRRRSRRERRLAIVLFNFPPNSANVGSAAFLAVFESLYATLERLAREGYSVDLPESVDALREAIVAGNAAHHGTDANVHAQVDVDSHVTAEPWLEAIEAQWGPAPGRQQSNGRSIFVLGRQFGNVLVGLQPAFGYEGDPMRLLFERGFAPTHAFAAFYRYLRRDFGADAVLHFGTHGALEFMPGKQSGLCGECWPDRLLGDLPNFYLYAANNPSEATIAKRRSAATIVSYLTPPITAAGLHAGLTDLRALLDRLRAETAAGTGNEALEDMLIEQAAAAKLFSAETLERLSGDELLERVGAGLHELEHTLIPDGLHVLGRAMPPARRRETLAALAVSLGSAQPSAAVLDALVAGASADSIVGSDATRDEERRVLDSLAATNAMLCDNRELAAIIDALDGRFVAPGPSGDLIRTPGLLPTGRNIHGFDPFKLPSRFALAAGRQEAAALLARSAADGLDLPESVALVLWGTDNLKSEGVSLSLALALIGAEPCFDEYGRLRGTRLVPLATLGRPRVDVVVTLSGIFRDLLPLQTRMLAEAAYLAATADEDPAQNFVRKHALAAQDERGDDMESAALRVFSNAQGAYGANVNHLVENGSWQDEDELAETFSRRKAFAYSRSGGVTHEPARLKSLIGTAAMAYQNIESAEMGVTTLDQYFDTLGGISRTAAAARDGETLPVYIGDQTRSDSRLRSLREQVTVETHTRLLNEKWYEPLLEHGYEGVRQIHDHVRNTFGWSATSAQVEPWVYQRVSETYLLDQTMRRRIAELNPAASAQMASRLIEAHERDYWTADEETLEGLRAAQDELEDRMEGINVEVAA